jgi:peptidoglycan/xylan/chitin deacetylase (PgdA/CDA1 family)
VTSFRAILTYHSLDSSGSPISVPPDAFAGHVRWLAASNVRVLPLTELWADVQSGSGTGDAVAITFDDGFENVAEHALPVLREFGLPATVFVVSRNVGGDNRWQSQGDPGVPVLPLMNWATLEHLAANRIEIGGHTRTHRRSVSLSPAELEDEIAGGAEDIRARLGVFPATFAYPYGSLSAAARACVARTFKIGVTTEMKSLSPGDDAALLPRLDAYYFRNANGLDGFGSASFRAYVRLRHAIRVARRVVRF